MPCCNSNNIIFSADYGSVFNLRQLNIASGEITTISNVMGGAFSPTQTSDSNGENTQGIYYII